MNTQTKIYHNTTGLTGEQLTKRRLRAGSQNDKIYRFFRIHSCSVFTTWDIVDNFPEISIRSAARSVTDLTTMKRLEKTDIKKLGPEGAMCYTWRYRRES